MIITSDSRSVDCSQPITNYKTICNLSIVVREGISSFKSYGRPQRYDKFTCQFQLIIPTSQALTLSEILKLDRDETITISDFEGFNPFGPQFSDTSIDIKILDTPINGRKYDVYGDYFIYELIICPDQILTYIDDVVYKKEGSLTFAGLPLLQDASLNYTKSYSSDTQYLGFESYTIDFSSELDNEVFDLDFKNSTKETAGMILKRIFNNYRQLSIPIVGATNYFIRGVENGSAWAGNVGIKNNKIEIRPGNGDFFDFSLECYVA
jgi:hypothetical protein